jgi:hypothetical protein
MAVFEKPLSQRERGALTRSPLEAHAPARITSWGWSCFSHEPQLRVSPDTIKL